MATHEETPAVPPKFDFTAYPPDTLFYDRREGRERRDDSTPKPPPGIEEAHATEAAGKVVPERRARKERRRRIDPTTFEKQYTEDEMEFMNAMQNFKVRTGKAFPSHGEVLRVALSLGYRMVVADQAEAEDSLEPAPLAVATS